MAGELKPGVIIFDDDPFFQRIFKQILGFVGVVSTEGNLSSPKESLLEVLSFGDLKMVIVDRHWTKEEKGEGEKFVEEIRTIAPAIICVGTSNQTNPKFGDEFVDKMNAIEELQKVIAKYLKTP